MSNFVLINRLQQSTSNWSFHLVLQLVHPVLNILVFRINRVIQIDFLVLGRSHGNYMLFIIELDFVNVLEHLLQVGLHRKRLLGLRQYFKQLVVAQEEKSSKFTSFTFQIIIQWFLNLVQTSIVLFNSIQKVLNLTKTHDVWIVPRTSYHRLPKNVSHFENFTLFVQLLSYIRRIKDRLKIHPVYLKSSPLLQNVRDSL